MTPSQQLGAFTRTPHLVALVAHAERLLGRVREADEARRAATAERLVERACVSSLRLDGARLDEVPDLALADEVVADVVAGGRRSGSWFDAFATFEDEDPRVRALEFRGVRDATLSHDLAPGLFTDPVDSLRELHRRLTVGLVAPEHAGEIRRTAQAMQDASTGRVLFFPTDPERIETELHLLASWLEGAAAREHAIVTSGVVHLELLRIHPFEAANGRLARAAARLLLRARGLDPDGLLAPEVALAAAPVAYYDEVRRTMRRRDLTIWLERWGEAVVEGARLAARELDLLDQDLSDRATAFLAGRESPRFTVADYRADAGVGPEESRADLEALLDAGRIELVPGSRGLRFTMAAG